MIRIQILVSRKTYTAPKLKRKPSQTLRRKVALSCELRLLQMLPKTTDWKSENINIRGDEYRRKILRDG